MVASPFANAPINDNTGKISNNKGGGAPAMTMAIGEDGGSVNPPSSGGPDVKAVDPKGGGGAPPATTMAIGEDGTGAITNPPAAPGTPVEALPVDLGTENLEGGPAVLPEFNPDVPSGVTRAIGEDGTGPGLADLIVPKEEFTVTTTAFGEEGNPPLSEAGIKPNLTDLIGGLPEVTTMAKGEEDGTFDVPPPMVTTQALGEEGDEPPFPGGEILQPPGGGQMITQAMFEDGMPTPPAPPVANPYQPQPRPPMSGGKGGGMQPQPQPVQPYQPPPFQPYQPQPFMPQPPMYGGGFGMPFGGSFGSPYGNPYGGGFGGGYGMQRPQPFGGSFYGNPYMPPPPPTPYGGGKGGGFGQQQMPQPQVQPQPQPQPGGKGGGQAPIGQNSTGGNFGNAPSPVATQAFAEDDFIAPPKDPNATSPFSSPGGFLGMLGAGSLLGGQQNTGGSSNNASPFGGSSGGGSRTAMF